MSLPRVLVNGAAGRMGQATVAALEASSQLQLVGQAVKGEDLAAVIEKTRAQVVVDFTVPEVVFANAQTIIAAGARPVIGTTGLTGQQVEALQAQCAQQALGGVIAPNFSIAMALLMRFSQEAARYLPHVEIVELHHDAKLDAPSGTALRTAEMIDAMRSADEVPTQTNPAVEAVPGSRGATHCHVPIHAVRLPGLVAHQEVIFGGESEMLRLRHDSLHRRSFMPGVCLACVKVMDLSNLVHGLDKLL